MSPEIKLGILILGNAILIYLLLKQPLKMFSPKEISKRLKKIRTLPAIRVCTAHSKEINKGQLAVIDNNNCDFCPGKSS